MKKKRKNQSKIIGLVAVSALVLGGSFMIASGHVGTNEIFDKAKILAIEKETDYQESDINLNLVGREDQSVDPYYISSLVVGEMMNPETIEKVNELKKEKEPMVALDQYEIWHFNHRDEVKRHPYESQRDRVIFSYDTMKQSENYYKGASVGLCYDFAVYNTAILRLMGVPAEECLTLTTPEHAYVLFRYGEKDYIFSNNQIELYQQEGQFSPLAKQGRPIDLKDYYFNLVGRLANDVMYTSGLTEKPVYSHDYLSRYNAYLNYDFDPTLSQETMIKALDFSSQEDLDPTSVLTNIYTLSQNYPKSQYSQGKYEAQSLLVKYPNLYFKAFDQLEMMDKVMIDADLQTPQAIFDYLNERIKVSPDLHGDDRVYSPFQLEIGSEGTAFDRGLYAACLLRQIDTPSSIVLTDQGAYLYLSQTEAWVDTSTFDFVDRPKGSLIVAFNEDYVDYPALDRHTYPETSKMIEDLYPEKEADHE